MIDLTDTTFIIPARIDSSDRLRNITTAVNYLKKYCNTKIFIIEQDAIPKIPKELATIEGVEYTFLRSTDALFYKTLCINDAIKFITTKNIVIYDTDALIPVKQLEQLNDALDKFDMVYPYDGAFLDIPERLVSEVVKRLSVEEINPLVCERGLGMPELTPDRQSFGGAVAFNTKKFIDGGMMNLNIVSYGPEDAEVYIRFKKLDYTITRLNGPIFHLHHVRGINSSDNHHRTQKNHEEFKKIMEMSKELLRFFVNTWPWRRDVLRGNII